MRETFATYIRLRIYLTNVKKCDTDAERTKGTEAQEINNFGLKLFYDSITIGVRSAIGNSAEFAVCPLHKMLR